MITILEKYNLQQHNTFRIEASCSEWVEYTSVDDIPAVVSLTKGKPFVSIGEGSNILFTDDYHGVVLHSRILDLEMNIDSEGDLLVKAGAGLKMDDLIGYLSANGWWGLENLSLIPGTVGASVVQNIGAYGAEAKDSVVKVECYDVEANMFVTFDNKDCDFSYRNSFFKKCGGRYIVTYVIYKLRKNALPNLKYGNLGDRLSIKDTITPLVVREEIIKIRNEKLPPVEEIGSAGSFFKNPVISEEDYISLKEIQRNRLNNASEIPHYAVEGGIKIPAAWLIEQCGFKGKQYGNVAVWKRQPLIIVNLTGKATSAEILELESKIIETVKSTFGIELEPEVDHI